MAWPASTASSTAEAGNEAVRGLDWNELEQVLQSDPQALLIDVREAYEYAAAAALCSAGRTAVNLPLTELQRGVPRWLAEHRHPVVFFCRVTWKAGWHWAQGLHLTLRLLPIPRKT